MPLFNYIKERVWQKLHGRECKLLSQAGREVLIKAVIQAIPSYAMGLWCPNPPNVDKYEGEFGLHIYSLVGFLIVLQVSLKQSLNSPTTSTLMAASPKTLSVLELASSPLSCISLSSFVLPPGVYSFPPFLLTSCLLPLYPYILSSE